MICSGSLRMERTICQLASCKLRKTELKMFMLRSLSPFTPLGGGFDTEGACLEYDASRCNRIAP